MQNVCSTFSHRYNIERAAILFEPLPNLSLPE
jgi:hypothetical protein